NAYHGPLAFDESREQCRARLGLPAERVVLLTICRLMIWKGVDGLIRALAALPAGQHLYVAGEGDELQSWTELAAPPGPGERGALPRTAGRAARLGLAERVHFLGHVPHEHLMAWIRAADVFLLNSTYEGLSHTLLEA